MNVRCCSREWTCYPKGIGRRGRPEKTRRRTNYNELVKAGVTSNAAKCTAQNQSLCLGTKIKLFKKYVRDYIQVRCWDNIQSRPFGHKAIDSIKKTATLPTFVHSIMPSLDGLSDIITHKHIGMVLRWRPPHAGCCHARSLSLSLAWAQHSNGPAAPLKAVPSFVLTHVRSGARVSACMCVRAHSRTGSLAHRHVRATVAWMGVDGLKRGSD